MHSHCGSVAERLKAPVLKTGEGRPSQSSNLCASAIYFYGRIHCNVIESTRILVVMRLRGFFYFLFFISTFSLILCSSRVIHFNLHLELVPKCPPKNIRTILYFLLNAPISFYIIQRIKKMLGNYSWQDLLKN